MTKDQFYEFIREKYLRGNPGSGHKKFTYSKKTMNAIKMFVSNSSNLKIENKNRNEFPFACQIGKDFVKTYPVFITV